MDGIYICGTALLMLALGFIEQLERNNLAFKEELGTLLRETY